MHERGNQRAGKWLAPLTITQWPNYWICVCWPCTFRFHQVRSSGFWDWWVGLLCRGSWLPKSMDQRHVRPVKTSKAALVIWQLDPPTRRQVQEGSDGTPSGRGSTSGIGGILWSLLVLYCSMMTVRNGQQGEAKPPLRDAGLVSPPGEPQSWLSRRAIWKGWWRMSRDHGFKADCRKGAVLYLPF